MQAITKGVGADQPNVAGDVALIEAMLVKIQKPVQQGKPGGGYLAEYNGTFDTATTAAITAFQTDKKLSGAQVTAGKVAPGDGTYTALVAALPEGFTDLRVLANHRTVYLPNTQAELTNRLVAAAGKTFTADFRTKLNSTIQTMFDDYGIAIGVDPQGDRRTFQAQYDLRTSGRGVTNAGPGESNHNFGGAADLGLKGLRWLQADGTVAEETSYWLEKLTRKSSAEATGFWDALRAAGTKAGAFRGPLGDRPHLQNWSDAGVSMVSRLAAHLTQSGTMHWTAAHGVYSCDLGFGGELVPVGTSVQIWSRQATVTAAVIRRLRAAAAAHPQGRGAAVQPQLGAAAQAGAPGRPQQQAGAAHPGPADRQTDEQEVAAMRAELRRQFELADANWQNWTAAAAR